MNSHEHCIFLSFVGRTTSGDHQHDCIVCAMCSDCFCNPCIVRQGHVKIGAGQNASPKNRGLRKMYYKMFWACLANLGVWRDPRYLSRKRNAGHGVYTKRELMPACVVDHVRALYPNPVGVSYMGHTWE